MGLQRRSLKRWLQWLLFKLDMLGLCSSVLSKDPCRLGDCPLDLQSKLPDGGPSDHYSVGPVGSVAGCSSGSLEAPLLLLTLWGHCENEMKKYPFVMVEAQKRRSRWQETEAPAIQCHSENSQVRGTRPKWSSEDCTSTLGLSFRATARSVLASWRQSDGGGGHEPWSQRVEP